MKKKNIIIIAVAVVILFIGVFSALSDDSSAVIRMWI